MRTLSICRLSWRSSQFILAIPVGVGVVVAVVIKVFEGNKMETSKWPSLDF